MSAKININFKEKKWSNINLKKISKKAFKSTFKILAYSKIYKFVEVSILACNDKQIKHYNKIFRNYNKSTNVLSWPRSHKIDYRNILDRKDISFLISQTEGTLDIGDIAISYDKCLKESKELDIYFENYIIHMFIHSCLHLLGFDHQKKSEFKIMKEIEIKSLQECGIINPHQIIFY